MFSFEQTSLENKRGSFAQLRDFFNEHGYVVGGNWDYEQGYFDKKIEDKLGYLFIRLPVFVEAGSFGEDDAQLRIGTPFLLRHKYNPGLDDYVDTGNVVASMNQFQEPIDPDASLGEEEIDIAQQEIRELERAFRERNA